MNIPDKFYVARCVYGPEEIVGYMVDASNESTKGYKTKKEKADSWAHSSKLPPLMIDNSPRSGFHLVTNVSRHSTSNVVWRCLHPEGFEFEITSDNFCDLLQTNTIVNGEIKGELFFTSNKKLVNENTKLFAAMIKKEEKKNKIREKMKELVPGNAFRLEKNGTKGEEYIYMGKYHAITNGLNYVFQIASKSSLYHVLKRLSDNSYILRRTMELDIVLLDYLDIKIDKEQVVKDINQYYRVTFDTALPKGKLWDERVPLLVNVKPFKREDLLVQYNTVPLQVGSVGTLQDHLVYRYVAPNKSTYRVFGFIRKGGYNHYSSTDRYIEYKFSPEVTEMFCRKGEQLESGDLELGVDIRLHYGFGHYGNIFQNPCERYSRTNSDRAELTNFSVPSEIEVGYYKLQGE